MSSITQVLFGELEQGRLARLPFVLYVSAIHLSLFLFVIAVVMSAGLAEHAARGDIEAAQQALSDWMSIPTLLTTGIFSLAVLFANFNVLAKRIRDIGLPGWSSLLLYVVVRSIAPYVVGDLVGLILDALFMLVLCFASTDRLQRDDR